VLSFDVAHFALKCFSKAEIIEKFDGLSYIRKLLPVGLSGNVTLQQTIESQQICVKNSKKLIKTVEKIQTKYKLAAILVLFSMNFK
jgi:hypothetical protein